MVSSDIARSKKRPKKNLRPTRLDLSIRGLRLHYVGVTDATDVTAARPLDLFKNSDSSWALPLGASPPFYGYRWTSAAPLWLWQTTKGRGTHRDSTPPMSTPRARHGSRDTPRPRCARCHVSARLLSPARGTARAQRDEGASTHNSHGSPQFRVHAIRKASTTSTAIVCVRAGPSKEI